MVYKVKVFIYYSFLLTFLLINPNFLFSQNNLNVENLLNKLQIAETNDVAKKIREQIWNKWIYAIPQNAQQNLKYALNEFNSGRLLSAEKAFTDLIKKYPNSFICSFRGIPIKGYPFFNWFFFHIIHLFSDFVVVGQLFRIIRTKTIIHGRCKINSVHPV